MYRRNLDIAIAAVIAILGGLAAAAHLPGHGHDPARRRPLLRPRLPVVGGDTQPAAARPRTRADHRRAWPSSSRSSAASCSTRCGSRCFKSSWIGLLVVLTLLGVVAVAVQRLREVPVDQRQQPTAAASSRRPPAKGGLSVVHAFIFGLAAVIAIGSVAYSVKNAEAQKFPGYTQLWMTPVVDNPRPKSRRGQQPDGPGPGNPDARHSPQKRKRILASRTTRASPSSTAEAPAEGQTHQQRGPSRSTDGQSWQTYHRVDND